MTINLGDYYKAFITKQLEGKRYGTASEVVKAALRLLEEKETSTLSKATAEAG